jgi:hypothetical protein
MKYVDFAIIHHMYLLKDIQSKAQITATFASVILSVLGSKALASKFKMSTSDDFRKLKPLQKIRTLAWDYFKEGIEETITEPIFGEDLLGVLGSMTEGGNGKVSNEYAHTTLQSQTYYAEGTTKGLIKLDQGSKALQDGQYTAILTNLRNIRTRNSLAESYAQISDLEATLIQAQLSLQAHYIQMRSSEILASPVTSLLELSQATRLQPMIHGKQTFTVTVKANLKDGSVMDIPVPCSEELTYAEFVEVWTAAKMKYGLAENDLQDGFLSEMGDREIHALQIPPNGLVLSIPYRVPDTDVEISVLIDPSRLASLSPDLTLNALFRTSLQEELEKKAQSDPRFSDPNTLRQYPNKYLSDLPPVHNYGNMLRILHLANNMSHWFHPLFLKHKKWGDFDIYRSIGEVFGFELHPFWR